MSADTSAAPSRTRRPTDLAAILDAKQQKIARALGAESLDELVRIPPRRYSTPGPLTSMTHLHEGEGISVLATVVEATARRMSNRRGHLLSVRIQDDEGGQIALTFFLFKDHLVGWHTSRLTPGARVLVSGTVSSFRGAPQINHPEYLLLGQGGESEEDLETIKRALEPAPVYPLRDKQTQPKVRAVFERALQYAGELEDPIPESIRTERGLPPLAEAVRCLHAPTSVEDAARALDYFRYEEAFLIQSIFARRRAQDAEDPAPVMDVRGALGEGLDARLPFTLTSSQRSVGAELEERLERPHPTSVLVQGDVGSGKTIVALRAMVRAVDSGHQAALLAPTDVLARQHYETITRLLGEYAGAGQLEAPEGATRVVLLVGSQKASERRDAHYAVMNGEAGIVVGTHALLTESVEFASLGLVVIDEQHRFGVDHRRQLRGKAPRGMRPHMIAMTATPIPRSAALTVVGDLDSLVLEHWGGASGTVASFVVPLGDAAWRERMWARVREEIRAGRQAFVVCARISEAEESGGGSADAGAATVGPNPVAGNAPEHDSITLFTVESTLEWLGAHPAYAGVRMAALHGRLSRDEKKRVMEDFALGDLDLVVATTVIEVGVDVPNASVMLVLDADRFGLAQLHQLRGRIGRGEHPGIAFFATQAPRGSAQHGYLEELAATVDGFALAELDLERRGSGDLVGDVQSGSGVAVRFIDVLRDRDIVDKAREDALVTEALRRGAMPHASRRPTAAEFESLDSAIVRARSTAETDVERS